MPHWELSEMEAKALGDSTAAAMRHLDIRGTQKTVDFITFGACLTMAYVPRVIMTVEELNARRSGLRPAPGPGMGHNGGPALDVTEPQAGLAAAETIGLGEIFTGDPEKPVRVN